MATFQAQVAYEEKFHLGEGPLWDAARNRILWVDLDQGEERLLRIEDDGKVTFIEGDLGMSNGLAWSASWFTEGSTH